MSNKVQFDNSIDGFVNLHLHTSYSLLDGLSKPEDVVKKVVSLNQKSLAVSEHGNVFSSVKVHKLAKENNIKHIYAMEAYVTENRFIKDKNNKYYHLTILAMNEQGRLNLNKLASLGYIEEHFYFKPRIDHELLKIHNEGLIVLSGCLAGELQRKLTGGRYDEENFSIEESGIEEARKVIKWYRSVFGDRYFLEIQAHRDPRQQMVNRAIVDLANEFGIDYVVTTDSHYTEEDDKELHDIFIQIGTNKEFGETYTDCFIMSSQQVYDRLPSLTPEEREKAIRQSLIISDMCNVTLPLSEPIVPHVPIPEEFESELKYLQHLINKGWVRRGINKKSKDEIQIYKERLMYEFNAISKMGFEGYFLLVDSYVNSVERRGIARGSSGGSLIAYLLGITELDPIPYGLYFERFIDVSALDDLEKGIITRSELKIPDVDSDFAPSDRDKVIDFIVDRYGQEKFASIGQFGFLWDKSAIKDVGKVLNIPFSETNKITQELGDMTIEFARDSGSLKSWFKKYPKLFEYAEKIAGTPKSFGIHPCGRIISIENIDYYTAVAINNGTVVFQGDMDDTDDLGLVKVDILGLNSLDIIYDTLDLINEDYDYISPSKMDFKDEKVLNLFRNGETASVFQFESVGMKDTLRQVKPDGIEDLGVCNALFRPSSIKYIEHYAKRKHGEEEISYLHPDLEDILGETMGIWVFQEQMISLAKLSGMKSPDTVRKAIGKKRFDLMVKVRDELFDGLRKRGWDEEQLNTLWQDMIDFSSYSFNKSHAIAYAQTAFQMAKLKAYHPLEYMVSVLNNTYDNKTDLATYINECKRMGIKILPPDINKSQGLFTIEDGAIRFGLLGIKSIGEPTIKLINRIKELNNGEEFKSFEHFYKFAYTKSNEVIVKDLEGNPIEFALDEMIPRDATINLIKAGAFGNNKNELLETYAELTYTPLKYKERKTVPSKADIEKAGIKMTQAQYEDKSIRHKIFADFKYQQYLEKDAKRKQKHVDDFASKYISDEEFYEFDTMSCYITSSPFDKYLKYIHDLYSYEDGSNKILIVGTILTKEVKKSSRGGQYAKLSLVTPYGIYQGKCYSEQYSEYKNLLNKGETIVMLAKRSKDEFVLSKMRTFDDWKQAIERKKARKNKNK